MGIEQFGYWQLFMFYIQYGGFLSLGLIDGTFLKIGGKEYKNLDFNFLGFQLRILFIWDAIILFFISLYGLECTNSSRSFIIIMSCVYVLIYNIVTYLMYVLQAVNEIKYMSLGKTLITIVFLPSLIILILAHIDTFKPYVICNILSIVICLLYYISKTKEIIRNVISTYSNKRYFKNLFDNVKNGIGLLLSNICGMLILGLGRFMVDEEWGIKTFSVVSFSLLFVNFFMVFVQQGSLVLFPELRRWTKEKIKGFYIITRKSMSLLFPTVLLLYMPIYYFVQLWLPQYLDSAKYLLFLLPLCIFDAKMNLLCNTLFQVFNKVRKLLLCNVIALIFSAIGISISIFILKSLQAVVFSMLISIIIRSILAEILLSKTIEAKPVWNDLCTELLLVAIFISTNLYFGINIAFCIYLAITIFRLYVNRKNLKTMIQRQ